MKRTIIRWAVFPSVWDRKQQLYVLGHMPDGTYCKKRIDAIDLAIEHNNSIFSNWKSMHYNGYRCRKVTISWEE